MNILELRLTHILSFLLFLTTWTLLIVMFHSKIYKQIDLLFLTYIVMFIGLYLAHVNPKQFILHSGNDEIRDFILRDNIYIIAADILHILPFMFVYIAYRSYYAKNIKVVLLLRTLGILAVYYAMLNPVEIYSIGNVELVTLFLVAFSLYPLIIFIS